MIATSFFLSFFLSFFFPFSLILPSLADGNPLPSFALRLPVNVDFLTEAYSNICSIPCADINPLGLALTQCDPS
jgi:hypothetical protein